MGARLVSLVLTRWTHLSDRAFRVLCRMALTALDEATETRPACTYFAGRELLVEVLRNERGGDRQTAYRTVKRAVAELLEDTAVERVSAGRAGQNAVYRLTLLNTPKSIDAHHSTVANQGDTSGPPEGDTQSPPQGDTSGSSRGTAGVPPRNHEEPREEELEEVRRTVLPVDPVVPHSGGTLPPDPLRPQNPRSSGPGTGIENSLSEGGDQPPQPGTATHDRAREATPAGPALRLIEGTADATETTSRGLFPALVPDAPHAEQPRGHGFCLPCYANGQAVIAADPETGAACAMHLRSATG